MEIYKDKNIKIRTIEEKIEQNFLVYLIQKILDV